jgi:hydrocephalus-inducing protein
VFTVIPETVVLNPKMGIMVEFRANSSQTGKMSEPWQCQVVIGNDRKPKNVFNPIIFGNFITPILQFNQPQLKFKYLWEKGVPAAPITTDLSISNMGPLPTTINLKIDQPFSCPSEKLTLEKDAKEVIRVDFDPGMKQDRLSDHINGKLTISHDGHPHKDIVALEGEVCFPNLQILPPKIDFGCILNDTSKKKYLTLSNISEMPVAYEWSFLEDAPILEEIEEDAMTTGGKKKKKSKKSKKLPINEVFDILPVSGMLMPGQTENVEFTFYSGSGINYTGTAVCSCDGGPDYEVPI